jgi:hypothetical protein
MTKKRKGGVPVGYKHKWKYRGHWNEEKIKPGEWEFTFHAQKNRKGSAKGGLKPGQKVKWKIEGTQTATKVSGRTYKTTFKGRKQLVGIMPKQNKKQKSGIL